MSKKDKLINFIKNNPKNVRFEDLKKILKDIGYVARNRSGSHYIFTREYSKPITIPYKRPVKIIYVKQVLRILEEEEEN